MVNVSINGWPRGQSRLPGCHVDWWAAEVSIALTVWQTKYIRIHPCILSRKNSMRHLMILIMMIRVQNAYEQLYSHSNVSGVVKSLWTTLDSSLVQKIFAMGSYHRSVIMWLPWTLFIQTCVHVTMCGKQIRRYLHLSKILLKWKKQDFAHVKTNLLSKQMKSNDFRAFMNRAVSCATR